MDSCIEQATDVNNEESERLDEMEIRKRDTVSVEHGYIQRSNIHVYTACLSAGKIQLFLFSPATFLRTFQHVCLSSAFSIGSEQHYIISTSIKLTLDPYTIKYPSKDTSLLQKCW
jgi:hypothetical protein